MRRSGRVDRRVAVLNRQLRNAHLIGRGEALQGRIGGQLLLHRRVGLHDRRVRGRDPGQLRQAGIDLREGAYSHGRSDRRVARGDRNRHRLGGLRRRRGETHQRRHSPA